MLRRLEELAVLAERYAPGTDALCIPQAVRPLNLGGLT